MEEKIITFQEALNIYRNSNKANILKTVNQSEDKFWFNLFHEIGLY